jgi:hypothetical protein
MMLKGFTSIQCSCRRQFVIDLIFLRFHGGVKRLKFRSRPNITNITLQVIYSCRRVFLTKSSPSTVLTQRLMSSQYPVILGICTYGDVTGVIITSFPHILRQLPFSLLLRVLLRHIVCCCILLDPRDLPSPIVTAFYPLKSMQSSLAHRRLKSISPKDFHHHLCRQPPEHCSHIVSDCSLALFPPESSLHRSPSVSLVLPSA